MAKPRVLVVISGGVANIQASPGVEIMFIDEDNDREEGIKRRIPKEWDELPGAFDGRMIEAPVAWRDIE